MNGIWVIIIIIFLFAKKILLSNIFLWPKHFIFLSYHSPNHCGYSYRQYHHRSSSAVATPPNGLRCHHSSQHKFCPSPFSMKNCLNLFHYKSSNVWSIIFKFYFPLKKLKKKLVIFLSLPWTNGSHYGNLCWLSLLLFSKYLLVSCSWH